MADSIVTAFTAIFSLLVGFLLNVFYENHKEKRKTRKESLRIHFDDIRTRVIDILLEMSSSSLIIGSSGLVFEGRASVRKEYDFEQENYYESFEIHFPERAKEWKKLKDRALELETRLKELASDNLRVKAIQAFKNAGNPIAREIDLEQESQSHEDSNTEFIHSLTHLKSDFGNFAQKLADEVESIHKYQMGTFRRNKKCPICKKF